MGLLWAVYRACGATFPIDGFWGRPRVVLPFAEWLLPLAAVVHFLFFIFPIYCGASLVAPSIALKLAGSLTTVARRQVV